MPIEPIDNPYRVVKFQKTRRTRHVQSTDPEEKKKYHEEEETPGEKDEFSHDELDLKETVDETTEEKKVKIEKQKSRDSEDEEDEKPRLDIRI